MESDKSEKELMMEAKSLLKGCLQHFRNACTRIQKIGSVIPPDDAREFKNLCRELQAAKDHSTFCDIARYISQKWPKTSTWLSWCQTIYRFNSTEPGIDDSYLVKLIEKIRNAVRSHGTDLTGEQLRSSFTENGINLPSYPSEGPYYPWPQYEILRE